MIKRLVILSVICAFLPWMISCSSGKKKSHGTAGGSGRFMEDSRSVKTEERKTFSEFVGEVRERKREERRRFQDVRRPYESQGNSFRVYPWRESRSRSEKLHQSLRSGDSSIF